MPEYINTEEFSKLLNVFVEGVKDTVNKSIVTEELAPVVHAAWENNECSNCHTPMFWKMKYCHNCGARMDLKEEK